MENSKKDTFKDADSREWRLRFTVGIAEDLRDTVGFDFDKLQDGEAFVDLSRDVSKFAALLWMLCERQADAIGVTPENFKDSLDGDVLDEALEAMIGAIVNFTRSQLRGGVAEILNQALIATEKASGVMEEMAREAGQRVEEEVRKQMEGAAASGS